MGDFMKKRNAKEDFITAFWQLYQNKRIEKISICELCKLAGYNRTTFYVYYKDIFDLLDKFIEDLIYTVLENFKDIKDIKDIKEIDLINNIFFSMFEKNSIYIYTIFKNNHHYILEEKITKYLFNIMKENFEVDEGNDLLFAYLVRYQVSAICGLLKFWYEQNDDKLSKEELANLLFEISSRGIINIIQNKA